MFTNENSADAVYGSLDEARWSMECDKNGNVLSIWWNEGTCHLMGYDYDREDLPDRRARYCEEVRGA